jgi:chemotaxis protein methyltransferase CheR
MIARGAALTTLPEEHSAPAEVPPTVPFVGGDFPEEDYQQICELLKQEQGVDLTGYKDLCIKRRIATRIRAAGLPGSQPYLELLHADPQEQQHLLAALTIHVSQFFRNPSTYALLETQVLPELLQRARAGKAKLRIWSVGCATGEEPYSLALLCAELLKTDDLVSIIATDLSSEVLQRAKRALFAPSRVAEVPGAVLTKSFSREGNDYRLGEEIRERVRFFQHDILSDQPFYRADLILCRNVLIYFSRAQQQRVLEILAAALPVDGYLVLGRAETLVPACRALFRCVDPAERIYQRLADSREQMPESEGGE